mmetsp:Transcript_52249/g.86671  ORF Transcript_52249/g.86671 Transcript_52249/m.86671 type:complete len:239 (+) Transcript_52249:552-1268(+)
MVFDLIIEPSMKEIIQIRHIAVHRLADAISSAKVDRRCDCSHVEGPRARRHRRPKFIHVIATVVGSDNDERVNVRQCVSEKKVDDRSRVERSVNEQQGKRQCEEAKKQVRSHYSGHEIDWPGPELRALLRIKKSHWKGERSVRFLLRENNASLTHLRQLELLVRIRRVIVPLPHSRQPSDCHILKRARQPEGTQQLEIAFNKVRIPTFAQPVVMQIVVLDVPRLRKHPVEPISTAPKH